MKTLLQLDLESKFNKAFYSISKNSLKVHTNKQDQYNFDTICYKVEDINISILHDIVLSISEAPKQITSQFTVLLDRNYKEENVKKLIASIEQIELFKREKVQLGHFSIFNDCLYDYHKKKYCPEEQSFRSVPQKSKLKHSTIRLLDNNTKTNEEMQFYNRQNTLCEEIKSQQIYLIPQTIIYKDLREKQEQIISSLSSKVWKYQMQKKYQELENKKVIEFYTMKMGKKCKINIIVLNYNKSYSLSSNEKKQLSDLLMLFGADMGQIKYKTINVELINMFLKKASQVFFVNYFPLPLNDAIIIKSSEMDKRLSPSKFQQNKYQTLEKFCEQSFLNFSFLSSKSKETKEKIILDYLEEKEYILKQELDKMSERLKQLKVIHRVEDQMIEDLTVKSRKALEKLIDNINYLKGKGITNVKKHIEWLNSITQEKKGIIKEQEQEIDRINKKIIEGQRNHDYFVGKMELFRDKLRKNYEEILKKKWQMWKVGQSKAEKDKENIQKSNKEQLKLTPSQKQQLETYKQKLKGQLKERLKNCRERQTFLEHLNQLKKRGTKLEISKFEQKYIDLLHQ